MFPSRWELRSRSRIDPAGRSSGEHAFTLLELMTVIVIVSILFVVAAPAISGVKGRVQKTKCIGNLRSLQAAANLYLQDNQHWPQVPGDPTTDTKVVDAWVQVFSPYGLASINWVCPAIQESLQSPDLSDPANKRIDYIPMPFGPQRNAPFQSSKMPWFIEAADVHGNGQEIIFPDGHIEEAVDLFKSQRPSQSK